MFSSRPKNVLLQAVRDLRAPRIAESLRPPFLQVAPSNSFAAPGAVACWFKSASRLPSTYKQGEKLPVKVKCDSGRMLAGISLSKPLGMERKCQLVKL